MGSKPGSELNQNYIQRIPAEIHSEIFIHCADGPLDKFHTITIPTLITSICAQWRGNRHFHSTAVVSNQCISRHRLAGKGS
ncbi:hypothetical protein B0H10DRAFT_1977390 [Mycena sp. CBHHK59/15]|nr:hypothetical protein B0H10DRAFT_1977390 [Mycena sp. CBHHK59/15]